MADQKHSIDMVRLTVRKIAFLMPHQYVLPDLKNIAIDLCPDNSESINRDSSEYLLGAYEGLLALLIAFEEKGS